MMNNTRIKNTRFSIIRRWFVCTLAASLLTFTMPGFAETSPEKVIQTTVDHLLESFTSQRSELEDDNNKLYALVDEIAVPIFDMPRISKLVLSKNWKLASEQQRNEFAVGFTSLLIKTYATALFKYTGNEKFEFTRTDIKTVKGREFATVKSKVQIGDVAPIPVDYSMMKQADGSWKIYNLTVDGLNMVINYRKSYATIIKDKGLDQLILSLQQKAAG